LLFSLRCINLHCIIMQLFSPHGTTIFSIIFEDLFHKMFIQDFSPYYTIIFIVYTFFIILIEKYKCKHRYSVWHELSRYHNFLIYYPSYTCSIYYINKINNIYLSLNRLSSKISSYYYTHKVKIIDAFNKIEGGQIDIGNIYIFIIV